MDTVFLKSSTRFGFGIDVWHDASAYEIDVLLGKWTLTFIINR